jgi:uncharacterized protein (TIGR02246 family)
MVGKPLASRGGPWLDVRRLLWTTAIAEYLDPGGTPMRFRFLVLGTAVILLAGQAGDKIQAGDNTAEEVERAVQAIQTAFNKGDVNTLKRLMTDDHVTILTYTQFSNAADQLKVIADFKLSEYKIEGLKVRVLTKDAALVSYQATIKGTYKGKAVPSSVHVAEVWVKRAGQWLEASYQETPVDKK